VNNACADDCANRECGESLHLGANCGDCQEGFWCDGGACKDDCAGLECGASPKRGVDCGTCVGATMWCMNNACADDCANRECGDSLHIGVNCGDCLEGFWCDGGACKDDCAGLECGASPNVGFDCGSCPEGDSWWCDEGTCFDDCVGLECGQSPILDVNCGTCGDRYWCNAGTCADDCGSAECGEGAHGIPCGSCPVGETIWCDAGICKDDCAGRQCGASPFLEVSCGTCPDRSWCNTGSCVDDCGSAECGEGAHGVPCGSCPVGETMWCDAGVCKDDCVGLQCGESPFLEVSCGTCFDRSWCNAGTCEDDCGSAECGEGAHGVPCGSCPVGETIWCDAGVCKDDCDGRQCGASPFLEVLCGTCPDRSWCNSGFCEDDCGSAECGEGAHGISCGSCPVGESWSCDEGVCQDDCDGLQCGQSPILDVNCGTCGDRNWCNAGICEDDCGSAECGPGAHGISCGSCTTGESWWCDEGLCVDDCEGLECGPSLVLGVSCGGCGDGEECHPDGVCLPEMIHIPAGSFSMGCNAAVDADCNSDEKPYHAVNLSQYYIGKTEVTVDAYKKCVDVGACTLPVATGSPFNWGISGRGSHPINGVSWEQASSYCEWVGWRLPTEAEWERAARGTDGRKYPWGNQNATCSFAVFKDATGSGCGAGTTASVCSRSPGGDSPEGSCDMSGNLWEWVSDWYSADYYSGSAPTNPIGPETGTSKVIRGGSWYWENYTWVRASVRYGWVPGTAHAWGGFRCAKSGM